MGHPLAIREGHSTSALADFSPGNVTVGVGGRAGAQCGADFDDLSRAWERLGTLKKSRYFFAPLLLGIAGGFLLARVATLFLPNPDWRVAVFVWLWPLLLLELRRFALGVPIHSPL